MARQPSALYIILFISALLSATSALSSHSQCLHCHGDKATGQQAFHSVACVSCHAGNNQTRDKSLAHNNMLAFPGNLSNAEKTCGQCHSGQTHAVSQHLMTTARGMVETTRRVLGDADDGATISELGHSVPDSLLRKLCAGCHLGRDRETHAHSTLNRGGGCLACHLDEYPDKGHVRLTADISDARCFGCHSRSGRISLNFAGLAEFDEPEAPFIKQKARLPDGRLVQIKASDVHHQAGMACIDCHTGQGLMGVDEDGQKTSSGIDIQCTDCHAESSGVTERFQTRLKQLNPDGETVTLQPRHSASTLEVPRYSSSSHPLADEHARLSCDACHSQWAPQCFGCHTSYQESGRQFDYLEQQVTPGRWHERRWMTHSGLPALGVDNSNRIRPFVPGMIFTLEHPDLESPVKGRLFSPLSPHTTGKARSCQSCHCDSRALGLGSGELKRDAGEWRFTPSSRLLDDGIAEDAWQDWHRPGQGLSTQAGARPLNQQELRRILNADVACQ